MKLFVNEYKHTTDIISESMAVWWGRRFRKGYISMGICILLILGLSFLTMKLPYLLLELLPILMIVLFKVKEKQAVKQEAERMEVIYNDIIPSIRVEISEDIHVSSDKNDNRISFSDVENVVESKNLIILLVKGSMTVPLDKKGFISGNADECMKYLKERI